MGELKSIQAEITSRGGWEFGYSSSNKGNHFYLNSLLEQFNVVLPVDISDSDVYIKHVDSGVTFCFNVYDALFKWYQERHDSSFGPKLPGYCSPFVASDGFDSQYVGKVVMQKANEEPQWKDIDWKSCHHQILNTNSNLAKMVDKKIKGKDGANKEQIMSSEDEDEILFREVYLYRDFGISGGNEYLQLNVVFTECGWFLLLRHFLVMYDGNNRIREMTMNCDFDKNIVYREICVRECKDFHRKAIEVEEEMKKNGSTFGDCFYKRLGITFHEVKQLNLKDIGGSCSSIVSDVGVGELKQSSLGSHGAYRVPNDKINLLVANCCAQINSIENETRTRIQIFPLFALPLGGINFRMAYIRGSKDEDILHAIERLWIDDDNVFQESYLSKDEFVQPRSPPKRVWYRTGGRLVKNP